MHLMTMGVFVMSQLNNLSKDITILMIAPDRLLSKDVIVYLNLTMEELLIRVHLKMF